MKLELCSFSGLKIYPGHGKRMVKSDGKVYQFLNSKCESLFKKKRNPRKVDWTLLYRRKHKKGIIEETKKKRTRKSAKAPRAIVGASLKDIMAKRNMKPEVRKAQREQQAIKAAKERQRAKTQKKTPTPAAAAAPPKKVPKVAASQKATKPIKAKTPRIGGKR